MAKILVSFLGKGNATQGASTANRYKTLNYRWPSDDKSYTAALFGHAVVQRMRENNQPLDHWLILGTSGSMWDELINLLPEDKQEDPAFYEMWETLGKAFGDQSISSEQVAQWQDMILPVFKTHTGTTIHLCLMGDGSTRDSQMAMWQAINSVTKTGDVLTLDITHSYRHNPIIASYMATLMRWQKKLTIHYIYGAYDMKDLVGDYTPVMELDICQELMQASEAVASWNFTGNPAKMTELMGNPTITERLKNAWHTIQVHYPDEVEIDQLKKELARKEDTPHTSLMKMTVDALKTSDDAERRSILMLGFHRAMKHDDLTTALLLLRELLEDTYNIQLNAGQTNIRETITHARNAYVHSTNPGPRDEPALPVLLNRKELTKLLKEGRKLLDLVH